MIPDYFRTSVYRRLPSLMKRFPGSAFHFYSKPGIVETCSNVLRAFGSGLMDYRQYSAVKALPEPYIQKFLFRQFGFGFDCSSPAERIMAVALGAKGEDIFYSSNNTATEEFVSVVEGGHILNLDDITFIPLVPKFPETICFRLNSGDLITTPGGNVIGDPRSAKYGLTYKQIIPAYKAAQRRGAKKFGIHIMICSNDRHNQHFVRVARFMLEVAAMLYKKLGIKISFINIGGGFGIPYRPDDTDLHLDWIGMKINKLFLDFAKEFGWMPKFITESGRYITGPHGILVNPVLHVMQKYRHFVGVVAAMTGCPRPAFYGAYHPIVVLTPKGNLRRGPRHFTNVVGPKCENWDRLTPTSSKTKCPKCGHENCKNGERLLPKSIQRGDILVTGDTGAHSAAMADNYNARLRLPAVLDLNGTNQHTIFIRRGETVEDYFRTMKFPRGLHISK